MSPPLNTAMLTWTYQPDDSCSECSPTSPNGSPTYSTGLVSKPWLQLLPICSAHWFCGYWACVQIPPFSNRHDCLSFTNRSQVRNASFQKHTHTHTHTRRGVLTLFVRRRFFPFPFLVRVRPHGSPESFWDPALAPPGLRPADSAPLRPDFGPRAPRPLRCFGKAWTVLVIASTLAT